MILANTAKQRTLTRRLIETLWTDMNFDWVAEYRRRGGAPWSDSDFLQYGLDETESLYAWVFVHTCSKTAEWVEEMLASDSDFGIEETLIYVQDDKLLFVDALSDLKYSCAKSRFRSDLNNRLANSGKS